MRHFIDNNGWKSLRVFVLFLSYFFCYLGTIIVSVVLLALVPFTHPIFENALTGEWNGFFKLLLVCAASCLIIMGFYAYITYRYNFIIAEYIGVILARLGFISFFVLLMFNLDLSAMFSIINRGNELSSSWSIYIWLGLSFMAIIFGFLSSVMFQPSFKSNDSIIRDTIRRPS